MATTTQITRGGSYDYSYTRPVYNPNPPYNRLSMVTTYSAPIRNSVMMTVTTLKESANQPGFYKKITTGVGLKSMPYKFQIQRVRGVTCETYAHTPSKMETYEGRGYNPNDASLYTLDMVNAGPSANEIAACYQVALRKCLDNVKDQKVNLAQAFAERQKTADTIASIFHDLVGLIRAAKKGDVNAFLNRMQLRLSRRAFKKLRREITGSASKQWLRYQYGIKPLLNDIRGAAQVIADTKYPAERARSEGSCTITGVSKIETGHASDRTITEYQWTYTRKIVAHYEVPGIAAPLMASLGLTNPAMIAWELLPYSFVVDWALPIGPWLNNIDTTAGLAFKYGSDTSYKKVIGRKTRVYNSVSSDYISRGTFSRDGDRVEIQRRDLQTFPLLPFPPFKNPFSWTHVLSAAALVRAASR